MTENRPEPQILGQELQSYEGYSDTKSPFKELVFYLESKQGESKQVQGLGPLGMLCQNDIDWYLLNTKIYLPPFWKLEIPGQGTSRSSRSSVWQGLDFWFINDASSMCPNTVASWGPPGRHHSSDLITSQRLYLLVPS